MKKKVNVFGKSVPVLAIFVLGIALVSAALITSWGTITGLVTVTSQGLLVDGLSSPESNLIKDSFPPFTSIEAKTFYSGHYLENQADVPVTVDLSTTIGCTVDEGTCEGVTTAYYENNGPVIGTLLLTNKDLTLWTALSTKTATLGYTIEAGNFYYTLNATGLNINEKYVLIYYADQNDRFVNWGGDNPGALIATVTADSSGNIVSTGIKDIGMTLPHSSDWNANPSPDYCLKHNEFDSYDNCAGAKIWLVPSSDYDKSEKKVNWANPSDYLFETDLITSYTKDGPLTIPVIVLAGETVYFTIEYDFQQGLIPDTFTITTTADVI